MNKNYKDKNAPRLKNITEEPPHSSSGLTLIESLIKPDA